MIEYTGLCITGGEMMDSEKLKIQIGANIAAYRKRGNLTQAGLAEKLK